jgi:hypothetical protein
MRSIHHGSFLVPSGSINYRDNRHLCHAAIKKVLRAGPIARPDLLQKRRPSDTALNAAMNKKLSRQERLCRSNAHEALAAIKKVHAAGSRRHLPESERDAAFDSKSVAAMAKSRERVVPATGHRLPSAVQLNRAFSGQQSGKRVFDIELRKASKRRPGALDYDYELSEGKVISKRLSDSYRKGLTMPRESFNGTNDNVIADTGATNRWKDQPEPSVRPTIVGSQTISTPSMLTRDAGLEAIKIALRKPQKLFGNTEDTQDLDEDDLDESDDEDAKDANRDDAQR